eukprot:TRINITY_DN20097_c0_g1_i1.p1 TRINITY_DN20097_c0_g1~~TRINITY_DN20097_c0_g1_i1.p1  ORF type:complete len:124 (-),score=7.88 TRINITY_DN20097_c0_g1_i1:28-399(-)
MGVCSCTCDMVWHKAIHLFKRLAAKNRVEKLINIGTSSQSKKTLSSFQFLFKEDIDKHLNKIQAFVKHSDISSANTIKWVMHLKVDNSDGDWVKATINRQDQKLQDSNVNRIPIHTTGHGPLV